MATACGQWLRDAASAGATVIVPEIADYEVRRELIRARRTAGIARLDALASQVEYLAITTTAMRRAAEIRAAARQRGRPTAADAALDGDVILAGQATTLNRSGLPALQRWRRSWARRSSGAADHTGVRPGVAPRSASGTRH